MAEKRGVDRSDVASARDAVVFTSNANAVSAGSLRVGGNANVRFPRAVVVMTGTLTITTLDDQNITLPDPGQPFQWNIQFQAIAGGTAANIVVLY